MNRDGRGDEEIRAEACGNYMPLVASNLVQLYGAEDLDDAGCDSCRHWADGYCRLYQAR